MKIIKLTSTTGVTSPCNIVMNIDYNELKFAPAKPWYVRLWRKFFPLKYVTFPADGKTREVKLK